MDKIQLITLLIYGIHRIWYTAFKPYNGSQAIDYQTNESDSFSKTDFSHNTNMEQCLITDDEGS